MPLTKPCIRCGEDAEPGKSRCTECRQPRDRTGQPSASARGYDSRYRTVRARALRLQPWCECGATTNLTVDHSPESWRLIREGNRPTLEWFANGLLTVCCMSCNQRRGSARGTNVTRSD